jgi:futalosine hydrolase
MAAGSAGRPTLLLVPTALEAEHIQRLGGLGAGWGLVETIGFGPVAAAASTASLLERLQPRRVLLVGVAGSYDEARLPLESARTFERAAIDGIGAGEGEGFVPAARMSAARSPERPASSSDVDMLALAQPATARASSAGVLLTVCAASASLEQAERRRRMHPQAAAEDMEGFGVAHACARAGVPLCVVRGISNRVGERDPQRWKLREALAAARSLALEVLASDEPWEVGAAARGRPQAGAARERPTLEGRA